MELKSSFSTTINVNYINEKYKELIDYLDENTINNFLDEFLKDKSGDPEKYKDELKKCYKNENLVLVIGAGLSKPHGIPDWETLLQILYNRVLDKSTSRELNDIISILINKVSDKSPIIAARFIEKELNKEEKSIENEVKDILYSKITAEASYLLKSIVNICVAPGRSSQIDSVITYNFDDLLEKTLDDIDPIEFKYKSIYSIGQNPCNDEFPIYHVHGYLPRYEAITEEHRITLSENIYHNQYTDIYSWDNLVQLNKFKDKNCLFIGTSLSDPNLRRLLDIAKKQSGDNNKHFIIKKRYDQYEIKENIQRFLTEDLKNQKIEQNISLDTLSESLRQVIEKIEEDDAFSFNIKTIWVDSHEDFPSILDNLYHNK